MARDHVRDVRARARGWLPRLADEILEIADDSSSDYVERENKDGSTYIAVDHDHIARARLRVDARKWLLAKALPKMFGDRTVAEHSGTIQPSASPRSTGAEHLEKLSRRYADGLAEYKGEDGEDHMDPITRRFRTGPREMEGGTMPPAGQDHLAELSKRYQSHGGTAEPPAKPSSQAASSDFRSKAQRCLRAVGTAALARVGMGFVSLEPDSFPFFPLGNGD